VDENQGEKPLSSEELLKRAREGLGVRKTPPGPSDDAETELFPPPGSEAPEDLVEPEPEPLVPAEPQEPVFAAPPRSDPSSWAPPRAQPDEESGWQPAAPQPPAPQPPAPGPAPTPRRGRSGGFRISKMWIVVIFVVGGVALFSFFDTSKSVDDIAIGDCFDLPDEEVFFEVETVSCTEAHDLEVFALVDLSDISSEFSTVAAYPGDDAVFDAAFNACYDRFEGYVGTPYEESAIYLHAFTPTFEGWTDVDDRVANCVLYARDAAQEEPIKSSESFRDSRK